MGSILPLSILTLCSLIGASSINATELELPYHELPYVSKYKSSMPRYSPKGQVAVNPNNYVGQFKLSVGIVITFTYENGRYFTQSAGRPKCEIFPQSATQFSCPSVGVTYVFQLNGSGRAMELDLHYQGKVYHGSRTK